MSAEHKNQPASSPETYFSLERAKEVTSSIPVSEVIQAMNEAAPQLSEMNETILGGEMQRIMGILVSYSHFYEKPLKTLLKSGAINSGYSANELGPSLMAHWAIMDSSLHPSKITGVESRPHIAAGARVAVSGYQNAGFLEGLKTQIIDGNESTEISKADVAILSLTSQYEAGEMRVVDWMQQNGEISINGDYLHVPVPISKDELRSGIIPIKTQRRPNVSTCMSWQLGEKVSSTIMGDMYDAKILVHDFDLIKHVRFPEDQQTTRVMVFERNGTLYVEGWGLMPREDTPDDALETMAAMRATIHDLWLGMGSVTNGKQIWDGNAAAGIPTYAAEKGLSTAVMITTEPKLDERMGLVMLLKNMRELAFIYENDKDLLSQIGPGKKYADLQEFGVALNLALKDGVYKHVDLVTPPHITTITTDNQEIFSKIV